MLFGSLDRWEEQVSGPVWATAFAWLNSLTPDSPEGKTELQGEDLFGIVMSYDTWGRDQALLETHDKYIDSHSHQHHYQA